MMPTFKFEVTGTYKGRSITIAKMDDAFISFRRDISDYRPAFRMISDDLSNSVAGQFASEGSAHGIKWQELAPSTIKRRGSAHPILVHTGQLIASFQRNNPAHVEQLEPKQMLWGSSVSYALFHQTGTLKGFGQDVVQTGKGTGRGMPRRKILILDDGLKILIRSRIQKQIVESARRAGFAASGRGVSPLEARQIGTNLFRGQ